MTKIGVDNVREVTESSVGAQQEAMPEKRAKFRHSYVIKQLDSIQGNMDAVYRQLNAQLLDAEHESVKVVTALRRTVTKTERYLREITRRGFQWYLAGDASDAAGWCGDGDTQCFSGI